MSARTAMKHAIEVGWRWDALVLFDPPSVPPVTHANYEAMRIFENKLMDWALGRRRHFASVEELTEEYLQSRGTRGWVAGAHALMARSVLRRNPDGDGHVLVCAPENEAAIYAEALRLNLWPHAREFGGPVKLVGADPDLKSGPPDRAGQPGARDRERLRLHLRRRHWPSAADRETDGVRAPRSRVSRAMRVG